MVAGPLSPLRVAGWVTSFPLLSLSSLLASFVRYLRCRSYPFSFRPFLSLCLFFLHRAAELCGVIPYCASAGSSSVFLCCSLRLPSSAVVFCWVSVCLPLLLFCGSLRLSFSVVVLLWSLCVFPAVLLWEAGSLYFPLQLDVPVVGWLKLSLSAEFSCSLLQRGYLEPHRWTLNSGGLCEASPVNSLQCRGGGLC